MTGSELTATEFERWLDWLLYFKGIEAGHANDMALSTDDDPEAAGLFCEYLHWRP